MIATQLAIPVGDINKAETDGVIVSFMEQKQGSRNIRYTLDLKNN